MQKSCNVNRHFNEMSHSMYANFYLKNAEKSRKTSLSILKLSHVLIYIFVDPWMLSGFSWELRIFF